MSHKTPKLWVLLHYPDAFITRKDYWLEIESIQWKRPHKPRWKIISPRTGQLLDWIAHKAGAWQNAAKKIRDKASKQNKQGAI